MNDALLTFAKDARLKCECLVIGSGAGGSLTADFLSEKGKDVLIVEEGPCVKETEKPSQIRTTFSELWREGGIIPVRGNAKMVFGEGCCLGGTTMINSGLMHRLPPEIIEEWSGRFKVRDLDYGALQRFHSVVEKDLNVQTLNSDDNPVTKLFKNGAEKCGFRGMDAPIAADVEKGTITKKNTADIFLNRAIKHGAKIITRCKVAKIVFRNKSAVQVEAVHADLNGEKRRVLIDFEYLFVCAGAIQTPLLLRRSGITKNTGDNINFHPTLRVIAEFDTQLDAYTHIMSPFQIKEFAPDISLGASIVAPAYIAAGLSANWNENSRFLDRMNNMASFYVMTRCSSKGKVRNVPFMKGAYLVKYPLNQRELTNLSFGFAKLAQVLFSAGASRLFPAVEGLASISGRHSSDYYLKANLPLERLNLISMHAFSSCPMGEDTTECSVDSYGKLHGFDNVYINDASILPSSPGVNPQGPIMAIALRNLDRNFG